MSESTEIVRRLVAAGANYESIGRALGRNRSLVRQVGIGAKPGNTMRDALAELEARLAGAADVNQAARTATITPPEPRKNRRGALAKVRKPTTVQGRSWSASSVKRQAVRSGARGLGHPMADAAERGQTLAVTVTVDGAVAIQAYGTSRRGREGLHGSADFRLGDAAEVLDTIQEDYGGDVTAYVADVLVDRGLVDRATDVAPHIVEIDLRAFDE